MKKNLVKKTLILLTFSLIVLNCLSQEMGKIRLGAEVGKLIPHNPGFGTTYALETKYNITNNMNLGLRGELFDYFKHKNYSANLIFHFLLHMIIISILTITYFFHLLEQD